MKVLIVDDEIIIQKGIVALLQEISAADTQVLTARNGKMALECAAMEKPDLIITDIRMPVMDGLELARHLHERYPHVAVVILTGYADFGYARQALKYGVVDYLLKPVTKENLQEVMLRIILQAPEKWSGDLDMVRVMKETVSGLVRSVLAEDRVKAERLLQQWKLYCSIRNWALLELKQIMSHFYLAFTSELLLHMPSVIEDEPELEQASSSSEQLFMNWHRYLLAHIERISDKRTPRNKRIVDFVLEEIAQKFGETELNLQKLAKSAGVTAPYLSKMFREVMNQPITQYICEYRLEQARQRLEFDDHEKISVIAEQCGFNDYPYFSKVFKRVFGISPLEYREKALS